MFAILTIVCFGVANEPLAERLDKLAATHKGEIAIAVKSLVSSETYFKNADEVMPTASLIKLPIMMETFWQAKEKKIDFDHRLTLKKEDMVPGAGVLTDNFSPGATLTIRDAMRLMITVSDNTATNLVLDQIGLASTNARLASLGIVRTQINAKVFRGSTTSLDKSRTEKYGLGNTTAREMIQVLDLIHQGKVVSPEACEEMLSILKKNQDNEMMTRLLPPGASAAHKTGAVTAARTDAGIVYRYDANAKKAKPLFILCVLTNKNEDQRWVIDNSAQLTISQMARACYDYFSMK